MNQRRKEYMETVKMHEKFIEQSKIEDSFKKYIREKLLINI